MINENENKRLKFVPVDDKWYPLLRGIRVSFDTGVTEILEAAGVPCKYNVKKHTWRSQAPRSHCASRGYSPATFFKDSPESYHKYGIFNWNISCTEWLYINKDVKKQSLVWKGRLPTFLEAWYN